MARRRVSPGRRRRRHLVLIVATLIIFVWLSIHSWWMGGLVRGALLYHEQFPLAWKQVHMAGGKGGGTSPLLFCAGAGLPNFSAPMIPHTLSPLYNQTLIGSLVWYIPPHWLQPSDVPPSNIIEAAYLANRLANASSRTLTYSTIPQIIHQKWKSTPVETWPLNIISGIERWLSYAMAENDDGMAYFLWWDDGCDELIGQAGPELVDIINALPLPVEKYDIFRVLALNTFGGIVGSPLRRSLSALD
jgi:hypothetical protein